MEASADSRIQVRKITEVHANFSIREDNEPGQFSFQLILDDGAEEHLVLPDVEAAKVILPLLRSSRRAYFDVEKRVIVFGRVGPEGTATTV